MLVPGLAAPLHCQGCNPVQQMRKDNVISMARSHWAQTQPSLEKILSSPRYSRHKQRNRKMAAALSQASMGVRLTQALPHTCPDGSCTNTATKNGKLLCQNPITRSENETGESQSAQQNWTGKNLGFSGCTKLHMSKHPPSKAMAAKSNAAWPGLLWFECYWEKRKKWTWSWSSFPALIILHGMKFTPGRAKHLPL